MDGVINLVRSAVCLLGPSTRSIGHVASPRTESDLSPFRVSSDTFRTFIHRLSSFVLQISMYFYTAFFQWFNDFFNGKIRKHQGVYHFIADARENHLESGLQRFVV